MRADVPPDLAITLPLDPFAPRAARHHVAQVDRPSPDLRDAVVLLASELVTHAVERAPGAAVRLRLWMPSDLVRLEVEGPAAVLEGAEGEGDRWRGLMLDNVADRWESLLHGERAEIWAEIDRLVQPAYAGRS